MDAPERTANRVDLQGLIRAVRESALSDSFRPALTPTQWEQLGHFLQRSTIPQGQVLIEQGSNERTVYLLESGTLTVHYEDALGRLRLASVGPGSAVGEVAFFTREPRTATVQAASSSRIWLLTPGRFSELANRHPAIAIEVAMALGAMVSRRLASRPKRTAHT